MFRSIVYVLRNIYKNLTFQLNKCRPRVDRFVPPRESLSDIKMRLVSTRKSEDNHDIWYAKLQQTKYVTYLDEALGLESIKCQENHLKEKNSEDYEYYMKPWPCVPRKRSYLKSADSILDLPTYRYAALPELVDWSNDNVLVAALGRSYHKWSWRTQSLISKGYTHYEIQCCKFDPKGELLALGTENETIEIHNNALSKCIAIKYCECAVSKIKCYITAIDWSPTGKSFITGCSNGMLVSYTREAIRLKARLLHDAVISVKVSPDTRYVAIALLNGYDVTIMCWPSLDLYSSVDSDFIVKTITWHPWKTALLGVGTVSSDNIASISICDVPTLRVREIPIGGNHYSLDTMLFSHKTGELVMSLWNTDRSLPRSHSNLVVMSDPNTVVDQWGEGRSVLDRVRSMVFSSDGTKLATATADEDLIIWNFLPEDKQKRKIKTRRQYELPVYLDVTTCGYSIR